MFGNTPHCKPFIVAVESHCWFDLLQLSLFYMKGGKSHLIQVNISLYGSIAAYAGGKYVATAVLELEKGATISDILDKLGIPQEEKGYLFIDHVLCDAPGLNASMSEILQDGAHVGVFSTTHMWPYQYRDGIRMSKSLTEAMKEKGTMRNTYYDT
jgi:hypothetical protein